MIYKLGTIFIQYHLVIPKLEWEVNSSHIALLLLYVAVLVHTVLASAIKQCGECILKCEEAADPLIGKTTWSCFILMLVIQAIFYYIIHVLEISDKSVW